LRNLESGKVASTRKIESLMKMIRNL